MSFANPDFSALCSHISNIHKYVGSQQNMRNIQGREEQKRE